MVIRKLLAATALWAVLLAPCLVQAQESIMLGIEAKLPIQWPYWIAEAKGMVAQQGIKVDVISTGGPAKAVRQLAAGALHMADGGLPDLVRAVDKGAPVKLVAFELAVPPYSLMAKDEIKTLSDLKGKKIMIGGNKDVTKIYLDALMKPAGLKDADYDLLFAGATSVRYAALASGAVDAAILTSPFDFKATAEGYSMLGDVSKVLPDFPFTGLGVNTDWASRNAKTVTAFLAAWKQGIEFLYDPANKQESIDILIKAIGSSPEDTAKTYDYFVRDLKVFRVDLKIPQDSFKRMLDALVGLGELDRVGNPNRFLDMSYADAVK